MALITTAEPTSLSNSFGSYGSDFDYLQAFFASNGHVDSSESFSTLLSQLADAVEELSVTFFNLIFAVYRSLRALLCLGKYTVIRASFLLEPAWVFIRQMETATRWAVIATIILLVILLMLWRSRILKRIAASLCALRTQILNLIPTATMVILFDFIPQFYFSEILFRLLHWLLICLVPLVCSLATVADHYRNSSKRVSDNRGLGGHDESKRRRKMSNDQVKGDYFRICGRFAKKRPLNMQQHEKASLVRRSSRRAENLKLLTMTNGSDHNSSLTNWHYDDILYGSTLALWLDYWIVFSILQLFLYSVAAVVEKLVPCASTSQSPLDAFALLPPLNPRSCSPIALRILVVYTAVHKILEYVSLLLVMTVRQGQSSFITPLQHHLQRSLENTIEFATGLRVVGNQSDCTADGQPWFQGLWDFWCRIFAVHMPRQLIWISRLLQKLPHAIFLVLPGCILYPVSFCVGVIIPAISSLRILESYKKRGPATIDRSSIAMWVTYFVMLSVWRAVFPYFNLLTGGRLPLLVHIDYVVILGIQLVAASPDVIFYLYDNVLTATAPSTRTDSTVEWVGRLSLPLQSTPLSPTVDPSIASNPAGLSDLAETWNDDKKLKYLRDTSKSSQQDDILSADETKTADLRSDTSLVDPVVNHL